MLFANCFLASLLLRAQDDDAGGAAVGGLVEDPEHHGAIRLELPHLSPEAGKVADLVIVPQNPLANFKVLYGTGTLHLDDVTHKATRIGGVRYTIHDGIVYDAPALLADDQIAYRSLPANLNHFTAAGRTLLNSQITSAAAVAAGITTPFAAFANVFGSGATVAQAMRPYPQYARIDTISGGGDRLGPPAVVGGRGRGRGAGQCRGGHRALPLPGRWLRARLAGRAQPDRDPGPVLLSFDGTPPLAPGVGCRAVCPG